MNWRKDSQKKLIKIIENLYLEYSEDIFDYLLTKLNNNMNGQQLIEILVREYYIYIKEHGEIFHFVDQFANCPALSNQCSTRKGINTLNYFFDEMKEKQVFKDFRNDNLRAILFYPIKSIAINSCIEDDERDELLKELVRIVQDALLL